MSTSHPRTPRAVATRRSDVTATERRIERRPSPTLPSMPGDGTPQKTGIPKPHHLAGVIEKHNRSAELFEGLLNEVQRFQAADPAPYKSVGQFDMETWEWVERLKIVEEPPLRFGIILGDIVHNLRSALDQLMCRV